MAKFPKVLKVDPLKLHAAINLLFTGFKSEWATVKDHQLYVGGLGKAWTTPTGELVNYHPQYIKRISPSGEVSHIDWHLRYEALSKAAGISSPGKLLVATSENSSSCFADHCLGFAGYLIHESACWSEVHKRWFFLPRRESRERYDDVLDESRGSNLMLIADEEFLDIKVSFQSSLQVISSYYSMI